MSNLARTARWAVACALAAVALAAPDAARAVIENRATMEKIVRDTEVIAVAVVERVDPERPSAVLTLERELKGKCPALRLPILLQSSEPADAKTVLESLQPQRRVILFITQRNAELHQAPAYCEGTWFEITGQRDGETIRWRLAQRKPELLDVYKGSTAELEQFLADFLTGKLPGDGSAAANEQAASLDEDDRTTSVWSRNWRWFAFGGAAALVVGILGWVACGGKLKAA
ncbi:MAG: hypothetical protein HYS13_09135 [Planctomycetia bacterium]|nr:hypothetical protein [Planctomycetia bacterium]